MRSITTLLIAACLAGALLLAQTDRGAIRGSIVDATGAAVPGAQVVAANKGTQIRMTVLSLADGGFTLSNLPPGSYQITVEARGFKKAIADEVSVHIGDTARAEIQLEIGNVSESVEVTGAKSLVVHGDDWWSAWSAFFF